MKNTGLSNNLAWFAALPDDEQERVFCQCHKHNEWWPFVPLMRRGMSYAEGWIWMGGWRVLLGVVGVLVVVLGFWAYQSKADPVVILLTAVIAFILGVLAVFAITNRRRK
jgi:hypothetical protein